MISFNYHEAYKDMPMEVPCAKCYGCKMAKAREWALRCSHESQLSEDNAYITLTYNEENLPTIRGIPTLKPRDFVLFMKRLRKHKHEQNPHNGPIRFFQCGEYGTLGRPHHHALLFNTWFSDRNLLKQSDTGNLYTSKELEKLWPHGFSSVGEVTFESAGYVARYTLKKTEEEFPKNDPRVRPYLTMSRRPGIARNWAKKYKTGIYSYDEVITPAGKIMKPPRYYDQIYNETNPEELKTIKLKRYKELTQHREKQQREQPNRNAARELILRQQAQNQQRRTL